MHFALKAIFENNTIIWMVVFCLTSILQMFDYLFFIKIVATINYMPSKSDDWLMIF